MFLSVFTFLIFCFKHFLKDKNVADNLRHRYQSLVFRAGAETVEKITDSRTGTYVQKVKNRNH